MNEEKSEEKSMNIEDIEQKYKDNVYYQRNPEMFIWLMSYVQKYEKSCCKVISRRYRQRNLPRNFDIIHLMNWIKKVTSQFTFNIEIQTRVYCIVNGIHSIDQFPKCKTCGNPIIQNAYSFIKGFVQLSYCSIKCKANSEENKKMIRERIIKYGNPFGDPKQIVQKRILHYGKKNLKLSQSLKKAYQLRKTEILEKRQQTLLKNYGVTSSMLSAELRSRQNMRITYDGKKFDSFAELSLYIWLVDNKISFEFQPDFHFKYAYNEKEHWYFPDFKIGDMYFEIKGDHFFKKDGTMQNPYDHSQDELYEEKHQCMLKNNVVILKSNDYKIFEYYIQQTYGCNYLKQFKHKK